MKFQYWFRFNIWVYTNMLTKYILNEDDDLYLFCSPKCDPYESLGFTESIQTSICTTIAFTYDSSMFHT